MLHILAIANFDILEPAVFFKNPKVHYINQKLEKLASVTSFFSFWSLISLKNSAGFSLLKLG